jgi:hypothetical protein
MNKQSFKISEFLDSVDEKNSSLIILKGFDENEPNVTTTQRSKKDSFSNDLLTLPTKSNISTTLIKDVETIETIKNNKNLIGSDAVFIINWKNVENIPARLIEKFDKIVVLECLIDKEEGIYEEREFKSSLFEGFDLTIGNLFYIRYFERPNEARIEILDNPKLTSAEDFPTINFDQLFKDSKLFKK